MTIQHTARTGNVYYLHVGQRKDGKPNYFFSMKSDGQMARSLPEGFEIYENVGGQVFFRRKTQPLFSDEEMALLKEALKAHAEEWRYKIETKKDALVIHEAIDRIADLQSIAAPWVSKTRIREHAIKSVSYMAVMRFVLADRQKRLFVAERFCFRGSVDDWIHIGGPAPLPILLNKFIKHLGNESIYEVY